MTLQEQLAERGFARAGQRLPQGAAEHLGGCAAKMLRRLVVEQDDAPVAIDRIEAFADAVQDRCETRLGAKRRDFFGNEGIQVTGESRRGPGQALGSTIDIRAWAQIGTGLRLDSGYFPGAAATASEIRRILPLLCTLRHAEKRRPNRRRGERIMLLPGSDGLCACGAGVRGQRRRPSRSCAPARPRSRCVRRRSADSDHRHGARWLSGRAISLRSLSGGRRWRRRIAARLLLAMPRRRQGACADRRRLRAEDACAGSAAVGARALQSDLDLLLLYDYDGGAAMSDGPQPLPACQYYVRLAQRLIGGAHLQLTAKVRCSR